MPPTQPADQVGLQPTPRAGGGIEWVTVDLADNLSVEDATGTILDTAPTQDGDDVITYTVTKDGTGRPALDHAAWIRWEMPDDAFLDHQGTTGTKAIAILLDRFTHPHSNLAIWGGVLTNDGLPGVTGGIGVGLHGANATAWRPWAGNGSTGSSIGASNTAMPDRVRGLFDIGQQFDGDAQVVACSIGMLDDASAIRQGSSSGSDSETLRLGMGVSWTGADTPAGLVIGARMRYAVIDLGTAWQP